MRPDNTYIAVMSYGMGPLLENCLSSLARHAPGITAVVYDDGSTDPATQKVLESYSQSFPVHVNNWRSRVHRYDGPMHGKVGGLYHNMKRAYEDAKTSGFDYILFVQDDMQVVGPLDGAFFGDCRRIWRDREDIVQIRVTFYRDPLVDPTHHPRRNRIAESGEYYMALPDPQGINDTGVISIERLDTSPFQWQGDERANNRTASRLGVFSVFPKTPLIPQLPWPPTINSRLPQLRRLATSVADRLFDVGFHPYADLTPEQLAAMRSRDPAHRPFGEDFLTLVSGRKLFQPWCYENSYPHLRVAAKQFIRNLTGKGRCR